MVDFLRTNAVAKKLGVTAGVLYNAVSRRRIKEPPRDSAGQLVWFADDVAGITEYVRARQVCNRRFPASTQEEQK
jgi:hypothetical protein